MEEKLRIVCTGVGAEGRRSALGVRAGAGSRRRRLNRLRAIWKAAERRVGVKLGDLNKRCAVRATLRSDSRCEIDGFLGIQSILGYQVTIVHYLPNSFLIFISQSIVRIPNLLLSPLIYLVVGVYSVVQSVYFAWPFIAWPFLYI